MNKRSHSHLNGNFGLLSGLTTVTAIAADYQGKIAVVLSGATDTDASLRARKSELDGLAIAASIDAKKLGDMKEKQGLYDVFRAGYINLFGGNDATANRRGMYDRTPMVTLRKSLSIIGDGHKVGSDDGMLGTRVIETYNLWSKNPLPAGAAAR